MRHFPPFSPCSQTHIDSGSVERLIKACRVRLGFGLSEADIGSEMVEVRGLESGQVILAIAAARLLGPL